VKSGSPEMQAREHFCAIGQTDFLWLMKSRWERSSAPVVNLRGKTYFLPIVLAFSFQK
jgi:hypothetical protein